MMVLAPIFWEICIMEQVAEYTSGKSEVIVENTTMISAGAASRAYPSFEESELPGLFSPVTSVAIRPSRYIQEETIK